MHHGMDLTIQHEPFDDWSIIINGESAYEIVYSGHGNNFNEIIKEAIDSLLEYANANNISIITRLDV